MNKSVLNRISSDLATERIGKNLKRSTGAAWLEREGRVCPYCQREFLPRTHNQKTCGAVKCISSHRAALNHKNTKEAQCEICGAAFLRSTNKGVNARRTCGSKACAGALRKREMEKNIIICEKCGRAFGQYASGAKYCKECIKEKKQIKCTVCGKRFRSYNPAQKTCGDRDCINLLNSRTETTRLRRIATHEPDTFDIDFASLHTMNAEFPTMDCPECDPLTNRDFTGVWIETNEPKQTRKAA